MRRSVSIAMIMGGAIWLTLLIGLLFGARRWTLSEMNTPQAKTDWTNWREEVREQGQPETQSPVHRRIPKSTEPPMLLLMRDYFGVCLTGTVVFGTALYGVLAFLSYGALHRP